MKNKNMLALDEHSRKWALRTIKELKNVLTYVKINYCGLSLTDLEFEFENSEFIPIYSNIIESRNRRK